MIFINNVSLWFARDKNDNIITIDKIGENNSHKYYCPICNSDVIPKATKSNSKVSAHFAHIDRSKCSSESMIHWWFKHKFLVKGDEFSVKTDITKKYIVEEIIVEKKYNVFHEKYQPDVTIKTTTGETIYFEMAYSNSKKVEEYLDIWIELGNTVIEVDIKDLMMSSMDDFKYKFEALFYNGRCHNVTSSDFYYHNFGVYKESVLSENETGYYGYALDRVFALDWVWQDIAKYNSDQITISEMAESVDNVENLEDREFLYGVLKKSRCGSVLADYLGFKNGVVKETLDNYTRYSSARRFTVQKFSNYKQDKKRFVHASFLKEIDYVMSVKKSDLKTGSVLITRDGVKYMVLLNTHNGNVLASEFGHSQSLDTYTEDLEPKNGRDNSIIYEAYSPIDGISLYKKPFDLYYYDLV